MLPDRVSNPGPLTYESGALPIALRGPALHTLSMDPMESIDTRPALVQDSSPDRALPVT